MKLYQFFPCKKAYFCQKSEPEPEKKLRFLNTVCNTGQERPLWRGRIQRVEDIEENIWSPRLGIKGKIDLTVTIQVRFLT
jgi:hypothetical protein